jgi:rod shape-determining protein MreC
MDTLMGRYRNVSILAAAVFIQVVGLAVQVKRKSENQSDRLIRVWTITAVTPLEKGIVRMQTGGSSLWRNYIYLRGVRQENRALKENIEQLQLEQVRLRQDAEQARRLQALLGFKEQFIEQTVAAQVIGSSGSEQSRVVYIDKGKSSGIKEGMPVISAAGIVGKVILVQSGVSQVLLINDQTSGVGTILESSRLQGVLKGKASGELELGNVMAEEEVKPGERVLTSGGDQIFPKGLPVGTIDRVKSGGEFLQITVKPATSLSHLEEVLVITQKQEREPEKAGASSVRAADILAQRLPSVPDKPAEPAPGTSQSPTTSGAVAPKVAAPGNEQLHPIAPAGHTATPSGTNQLVPSNNQPVTPNAAAIRKPGNAQNSQTVTTPSVTGAAKPAVTKTPAPQPQQSPTQSGDAPQ